MLYNSFLALTQLPQEAAAYVVGLGLNPWLVMSMILILYLHPRRRRWIRCR